MGTAVVTDGMRSWTPLPASLCLNRQLGVVGFPEHFERWGDFVCVTDKQAAQLLRGYYHKGIYVYDTKGGRWLANKVIGAHEFAAAACKINGLFAQKMQVGFIYE